jgi:hypothetical protein
MSSSVGFKKLNLVKNALNALHAKIPAAEIATKWKSFDAIGSCDGFKLNDVNLVQKIAKAVALHYGIVDTTFIAYFNPTLKSAAVVEVRNSKEIYIEFRDSGTDHLDTMWATMAHEIAHIFLFRLGVEFKDTLENEVLTDTTAIYLGFGAYALSAQRAVTNYNYDNTKLTTTHSLGYISPDEIGYILAQRDYIRNEKSFTKINSEIGRQGYLNGKIKFNEELSVRPFKKRSLLDSTMYKFGWIRNTELEGIHFNCIYCKQTIKVPALHKTLSVYCPNCRGKIICYS